MRPHAQDRLPRIHWGARSGSDASNRTACGKESAIFANVISLWGSRVTYQDPCRLGRHLGVYDAPRQAIADLGYELVEMRRHAESSLCCGTTCWTTCGQVSKNIQVERLKEASATGAELLVTACQKCQIHFKCAQNDPLLGEELSIQIRDLTTLIADKLSEQAEQVQEVPIGD